MLALRHPQARRCAYGFAQTVMPDVQHQCSDLQQLRRPQTSAPSPEVWEVRVRVLQSSGILPPERAAEVPLPYA